MDGRAANAIDPLHGQRAAREAIPLEEVPRLTTVPLVLLAVVGTFALTLFYTKGGVGWEPAPYAVEHMPARTASEALAATDDPDLVTLRER